MSTIFTCPGVEATVSGIPKIPSVPVGFLVAIPGPNVYNYLEPRGHPWRRPAAAALSNAFPLWTEEQEA